MIEEVNEYYGGKKASELLIKKGWMSQKNRVLLYGYYTHSSMNKIN